MHINFSRTCSVVVVLQTRPRQRPWVEGGQGLAAYPSQKDRRHCRIAAIQGGRVGSAARAGTVRVQRPVPARHNPGAPFDERTIPVSVERPFRPGGLTGYNQVV
jgi:hypothetical protein